MEPSDGQCARVEFEGWFEQQPVRWNATIVTLARDGASRPYIEIGPGEPGPEGEMEVRVGLGLHAIDSATILKTIIMLRQYKRLRRGRMEFGTPLE